MPLILALALFGAGCSNGAVASEHPGESSEARALEAEALEEDACGRATSPGTMMSLGVSVDVLNQSADRILSRNYGGTWVLWDRRSGRKLSWGSASEANGFSDLAGNTAVVSTSNGVSLLDASSGKPRATIPLRRGSFLEIALSPDGRYLYASESNTGALYVWDATTGVLLTSQAVAGLTGSRIFSNLEELRLAPYYPPKVEPKYLKTLTFATGELRSSGQAYRGEFYAWFLDGSHFVTTTESTDGGKPTLTIYTVDGELVQTLPWTDYRPPPFVDRNLPAPPPPPPQGRFMGGAGEFFWVSSDRPAPARNMTRVYRLGTPEPVMTFEGSSMPATERSAMSAFMVPGNIVRFLDLRGSTPIAIDHAIITGGKARAPLVDAEGRWVYAESNVVYDGGRVDDRGRARAIGCGTVLGLAGSPERLAVATSDRNIRIYAVESGSPTLRSKIEGLSARSIALSEDGRTLVALGLKDADRSTGGNVLYAFTLDPIGRPVSDTALQTYDSARDVTFSVSADGSRIACTSCGMGRGNTECRTTAFDNGHESFKTVTNPSVGGPFVTPPLLSPSGRRIALEDGIPSTPAARATSVFDNLALQSRLPNMVPLLWVDEQRLIVSLTNERTSAIVDPTGTVLTHYSGGFSGPLVSAGPGRLHDRVAVYGADDFRLLWHLHRDLGIPPVSSRELAVVSDYAVFPEQWSLRFAKIPPAPAGQ